MQPKLMATLVAALVVAGCAQNQPAAGPPAQGTPAASTRTVVDTQADLPQFEYPVAVKSAAELIEGGAAFDKLAAQVQLDAERVLRDYDIHDMATLAGYDEVLRDLALIRGDAATVRRLDARLRDAADKPVTRLSAGLEEDAIAAALDAGDDTAAQHAAFRTRLSQDVSDLPPGPDIIDLLKELRAVNQAWDAVIAGAGSHIDAQLRQNGKLDFRGASFAVKLRAARLRHRAFADDAVKVVSGYLAANAAPAPNIWPARAASFTDSDKLVPVTIAVWDGGVDTSLFPQQLWTNPKEQANGKDDDGNGFVDDIHGFGFDEDGHPVTGTLLDFDHKYPGKARELRDLDRGWDDMAEGKDTPQARQARQFMAKATPETLEMTAYFRGYVHGTEVAGIALADNPAARLMVVRMEFSSYRNKPPVPTLESTRRNADAMRRIVAYLRTNHARVVNMSWHDTLASTEQALAANDVGATPEQRKALAVRMFGVMHDALFAAMRDAPEILFVAAAANDNHDLAFSQDIPANFDLPNLLSVGAVNSAGQAADFSNKGARVRIHAWGNGVDVVVPGGDKTKARGTSAAAPQVTNLAAKLLALDPTLTPPQLIQLILDGGDRNADGLLLLNPKKSVELLRAKH